MGLLATKFVEQMKRVASLIVDSKKGIIMMTHTSARITQFKRQVQAVQALQFDNNFIGNHKIPTWGLIVNDFFTEV